MAASSSMRTDDRSLLEAAVRSLSQRPDPLYSRLICHHKGSSDLPLDFPELLLRPDGPLRSYRDRSLDATNPLFSELNQLIGCLEEGDEAKKAYLSYIEGVCAAEGKSRWKLLKGEVRLIAQLPSGAVCLLIPRKVGKEIVATSSIGGIPLFTRSAEEPNIVIQLENLSLDRTPLFFGIASENRPITVEIDSGSGSELILQRTQEGAPFFEPDQDQTASIIQASNSHLEAKNYRLASLALINASLQIEEQFDQIESSFLRDTFGIKILVSQASSYREALNSVRSSALKAMSSGRPIHEVQRILGQGYKRLLSALFNECLERGGTPRSRYAFIALDRLSREELFPLSGSRFALLVERADCVDRFRNVADLLELKIIRLRGNGFSLQEPILVETVEGIAHLLPIPLHTSLLHGERSLLLKQSNLTSHSISRKRGSFLGFGGTYPYQTQALLVLKNYLNQWQQVQTQEALDKKKVDLEHHLYRPLESALRALLLFFNKNQLTTRQGIYQLPFSKKSKNALIELFDLLSALIMRSQLIEESMNEADPSSVYRLLTSLYQTLSTFIERPNARTLKAASLTFVSKERGAIHLAPNRGGKMAVQHPLTQVERGDSAGYTPLHLAVISEQLETVASLLEQTDPIPLREVNLSPLHLAVENGNYKIATLLLNHYPPQQLIELKDQKGETALHRAARKGNLEMVQLLLERGAYRTTQNQRGENPFQTALNANEDKVAQLILFYPSNADWNVDQQELFFLVKLANGCWRGKRPDDWIPEYLNDKPNFWVAALILNIACFNAERVAPFCQDFLLHQLEQLEYSFVQHEFGKSTSYTSRIRNYRAQLREIRERAAQSLEQRFPVPIDTVLLELTQDYKGFLADLLNECISVKGEVPPTRFAMVGLGSMSRNEVCPFSDVEFIFLVEEDNEEILSYFRSITRLISLKIANLGETNYSLPGRYSSKIDSIPSGFKMDSALSPLGQRGLYDKSGDELIGTPQRLANLQTDQSKVIIIRNAMSTSCLIAGEPALLRTYQEQVRLHLTSKAPGSEQTRGELMALDLIEFDVKEFAPQLTQEKIEERTFVIKRELYRLPQALINALCLYHGIRGANAFQRIDGLLRKGVFSTTGANQLKRVFRSVLKIRFDAHLFYGEEKETLYYSRPGDNSEAEDRLIITPELNKEITELYRILVPFHQKAKEFLDGNCNAFSNCSFYDQTIGNYDEKAIEDLKTNRHLTSAQSFAIFNLNNPFPHLNLGDAQLKIGEVREAIARFKETLSLLEEKYGSTPHRKTAVALQRLGKAHEELGEHLIAIDYYKKALAIYQESTGQFSSEVASCLMSLGNAYYSLDDYDQAVAFYNKSLTIKKLFYGEGADLDVAQSLHNLGCIYKKLCEYSKSLHHLERSLAAFKSIYQNQPHPDVATTLRNLGQVYLELGDHSQALEYQQKSLKMNLEIFGDRPDPAVATSYLDLGYLYESLGEYRRAISCHKKSLELSSSFYKGQNNLLTASSLTGLGNIYSQLEDYDLAAESYQTVLKITQEIYGDQPHSSVAMALYNLASTFKDLGQSKQSMEYHQKALAMRRKIYRDLPHSDMVLSLLAIGSAHSSLHKHQLAITFFEEALATKKIITINPFDPGFSPILNNLGDANLFLGQYDQAIKFYEDALEILKKTHGSRPHPEMVGTLNNLGRAYRKANNYQRSILYCSQAIELTTQIYGETHPKMAACLGNLGETFFAFDDPIKAIEYHQRALAIQKETYRDHLNISIAYSLNNLGDIYEELGDYSQARQHYQEALEVKRKIYQDWPHPSLIDSLLNLGRICSKLAELPKAAQYYQESLVIAKQAYEGEAHPDIVDCLANLGNALGSLGEQREAIDCFEQSLTMFKQIYGDNPNPTISALLMSLSDGYNKLGEFDRALEYSTASLSIERQTHGDEPHHYTGIALHNLGDTYKGLGQLDQAVELYQSASEIYLQTVGADHPHAIETKESLEAALRMREESKATSSSSST